MSAYKTAYIRLGQAEYKKLRDAEEQLRMNNLLQTDSRKNQKNQEQSIYENMLGIKKQNDQNFQSLVVDLEGEICRIENEASVWVENQAERLQKEFLYYQDDIQKQVSYRIDEIAALSSQQVEIKESEYNAYWLAQEERILSVENRWKAYENLALDWIEKDQAALDFIYATYQIDADEANQLELERQYLNQVIQQYNQGFFDIAASAGFQIFNTLSNHRFQLELQRSLQTLQYQNLLRKVDDLQATLADSQTVHAMDGDGNELPDWIDVNYWVEGRLKVFKSNIESLAAEIHENELISLDKIVGYSLQIDELSSQLLDLVTEARVAVLASQLRFNVAQIVVQSLEAQGFFLEQANYEKDDYRETFVARTCNYAGNEVVVSIDPDPGLDEGGKINIQSLDAGKITEHELHQRNFEIFNAILENGIEVGEIKEGKPDGLRIPQKISHLNIPGTVEKKISEEKYNHGRY